MLPSNILWHFPLLLLLFFYIFACMLSTQRCLWIEFVPFLLHLLKTFFLSISLSTKVLNHTHSTFNAKDKSEIPTPYSSIYFIKICFIYFNEIPRGMSFNYNRPSFYLFVFYIYLNECTTCLIISSDLFFICFLNFADELTIQVSDIVYTKNNWKRLVFLVNSIFGWSLSS